MQRAAQISQLCADRARLPQYQIARIAAAPRARAWDYLSRYVTFLAVTA